MLPRDTDNFPGKGRVIGREVETVAVLVKALLGSPAHTESPAQPSMSAEACGAVVAPLHSRT